MPKVDLGIYSSSNPLFQKNQDLFANRGDDAYQNLIKTQLASLRGDEIDNFTSIVSKYPHLSKEVIVGLIKAGANADTPGIGSVASLDGINRVVRQATAIKTLESSIGDNKSLLGKLRDGTYAGLKGATRVGFALLRSPYDYATTVVRDAYAATQGQISAKQFAQDLNPANMIAGQTTQFGALVRDIVGGAPGVDTGAGFTIGLESRVGKQQAKAMQEFGRINGQSFTIGRGLFATVGLDPNSTAYKISSGAVDAVLNIAADPSTWLGFGGVTKLTGAAKGGKALANAREIAKAEKLANDLKEVRKFPSKKALEAEVKARGGEIIRGLDNHYMRADESVLESQRALDKAVELETTKRLDKVTKAITKQNPALKDESLAKFITDSIVGGKQDETIDKLSQLSADYLNTGKAFPGALVVDELPEAGKLTVAAQGTDEFVVSLAGKGKKKLDILDLSRSYNDLAGQADEVIDLEIQRRYDLHDFIKQVVNDGSVPASTRKAMEVVYNSDYIDDIIFNEGNANLGQLIKLVADTKNAHAVGLITDAIENIWKVDGFSNIRAIHGGMGGIAITNTAKLSAVAVDISKTLADSKIPGKLIQPTKAIKNAQAAVAKAIAERDAALVAKNKTEQHLSDIKALRKAISDDPDLAFKIQNNPEYVDLKDIVGLETKIGMKNLYKETLRKEAGLIPTEGGPLSLNLEVANQFLLGSRFKVVADILAEETSAARIKRLFSNKLDIEIAAQLADAKTGEEVLAILRSHLGNPVAEPNLARSLALRGQAMVNATPLIKTVFPPYQKAINVVEKVERAISRVQIRSVIAPLDDLDRLTTSVGEWMRSAGVDETVIEKTIDKLVRAKAGSDRNVLTVRAKIVDDGLLEAQKQMAKKLGTDDPELIKILEKNMALMGEDRALVRNYANALLADGTLPSVFIQGGQEVSMDGAVYASQFLDTVVRLPDTQAIAKALRTYKSNKGILAKKDALLAVSNELGEHWRTAQLAFRGAYILRNVGEMQIRQYLSGHETFLSNPVGYLAMVLGSSESKGFKGFLSSIEKYKNDLAGMPIKEPNVDKALGQAAEEHMQLMSRATSAGDPRSSDAKVRLMGKIYKVVDSNHPNFQDGFATTLLRFVVDDMMQLVAKADNPEAQARLVEDLINNAPLKINNQTRTNVLEDIYNASRVKRGNRKVSNFDEIFLVDPDKGFVKDNLNVEGIRNWLFDPNSTASYQTALNNVMGSGPKGIYIRKLLADGAVSVPNPDGTLTTLRIPRYIDADSVNEFGNAEKAFRKTLEKAFPSEEMPNALAIYADTAAWLDNTGSTIKKLVDGFFEFSSKIENVVNFGPEYRMAYWDFVGRYAPAMSLEDLYKAQRIAGQTLNPITYKGRVVGRKHQTLRVINREIKAREAGRGAKATMTLDQVNTIASRQASKYVKEIFYDATRQNYYANGLRLIVPFAQAHFNTLSVWAKLSVKNPVQVYKFGKAYDALTKPGSGAIYDLTNTTYDEGEGFFYKDEFGTMRFRYPLVGNMFGAMAGLVTNGKLPAESVNITAPVQSLNLALGSVNPGVPGLGPVGQVLYSASGQSQAFGPTWDLMRQFVFPFGEPGTIADVALPSWLNKTWLYLVNDSTRIERNVKNWAGYLASTGDYGDNPFANPDARNKLMSDAREFARWNGLFTSFFQSLAPATPSQEVLARVKGTDDKFRFMTLTSLYSAWDAISKNNPGDYDGAVKEFIDKFGKNNIMTIISGSTKAVTGTEDAWKFLNQNPDMAAKYAKLNADIVPYFFPGGEAATAYYNWQVGAGRREKLTTEELEAAATELIYNMELSQIAEERNLNGYSNVWYSQKVIELQNQFGGAKPPSSVIVGRQAARAQAVGKALQEEAFQKSPVFLEAKEFYDAYELRRKQLQDARLTPEPDFGSSFWLNTKYRNELESLAVQLMQRNPEFSHMYYMVFANLLKENAK